MKTVNIQYEDKVFKVVESAKNTHGGNWHDFLLDLSRDYIARKRGIEIDED